MIEFIEIGYCRTGTRSLRYAMDHLGYKCWTGKPSSFRLDIYKKSWLGLFDWSVLSKYQYIGAMISPFYAPLSAACTNAKFILTVRHSDKWSRSCRTHYANRREVSIESCNQRTFNRLAMFGCTEYSKIQWLERYESHNAAVQRFFDDDRLLVIDVNEESEKKWVRLEAFTGRKRQDDNIKWPWIR